MNYDYESEKSLMGSSPGGANTCMAFDSSEKLSVPNHTDLKKSLLPPTTYGKKDCTALPL